ncbi:hypothetical protein OUZ56_003341 [Daphnia magna]|uniref:Uncharacterized protein n=1 Tax=Daphnia magna TaxID=35525 RepID=A0ABR0A8F4_9CRUS|nr:hypothetical protein OUZ56_003341 [Daphnia magna]
MVSPEWTKRRISCMSLVTWTPRRKSNRLANSKLNPIDLDTHPEAEPQEELDIVACEKGDWLSLRRDESSAPWTTLRSW